MPGTGDRLGKPTPLGRSGGTHGGRVHGGPGIRGDDRGPHDGIDTTSTGCRNLVCRRERGDLPDRLLASALLGGGPGQEDEHPRRPKVALERGNGTGISTIDGRVGVMIEGTPSGGEA